MISFVTAVILPFVIIAAIWKLSGRELSTPFVVAVIGALFIAWLLGGDIFNLWGVANLNVAGIASLAVIGVAFLIASWLRRRYPKVGCGCLIIVAVATVLLVIVLTGVLDPNWQIYRGWLN